MTIFGDASAIVSLYDDSDPNYQKAQEVVIKFSAGKFITSNFVFAEIVTILSQRMGKQPSIIAGEELIRSYTIIKLTDNIETLAWEIFKKQTLKNISFVDCTTFALYQEGVFDSVFTFDRDFKKNKIPILE